MREYKSFYLTDKHRVIMNEKNFSKKIIEYLSQEKKFLNDMIRQYKINKLIEIGCDIVRLCDIAKKNNIEYFGYDLSPNIKDKCKIVLDTFNLSKGFFINVDVFDVLDQFKKFNQSSIIILPFNFLGSIKDGSIKLLKALISGGANLLISQFNCTENARKERFLYYQKSIKNSVKHTFNKIGDLFYFNNFYSISYTEFYINNLMAKFNYIPIHFNKNNFYNMIYYRHIK